MKFPFFPTPSDKGVMFTNTITMGTVTFDGIDLTQLDNMEAVLMDCVMLGGEITIF